MAATARAFDQVDPLYGEVPAGGGERPLLHRLLRRLAGSGPVSEDGRTPVPRRGPAIVVANHPFGSLEGAALYTAALLPHRPESLQRLGPALEPGRSLVRDESQNGFAPLLRPHLRLGGKLLGFNVDPEFSWMPVVFGGSAPPVH